MTTLEDVLEGKDYAFPAEVSGVHLYLPNLNLPEVTTAVESAALRRHRRFFSRGR